MVHPKYLNLNINIKYNYLLNIHSHNNNYCIMHINYYLSHKNNTKMCNLYKLLKSFHKCNNFNRINNMYYLLKNTLKYKKYNYLNYFSMYCNQNYNLSNNNLIGTNHHSMMCNLMDYKYMFNSLSHSYRKQVNTMHKNLYC